LSIPALSFDEAEADAYRTIVESTGYSRRKLLDRMIAAQALAHRATLVTANGADFSDVSELQLLEW
jgi:predicted nucleic acid-binding protein